LKVSRSLNFIFCVCLLNSCRQDHALMHVVYEPFKLRDFLSDFRAKHQREREIWSEHSILFYDLDIVGFYIIGICKLYINQHRIYIFKHLHSFKSIFCKIFILWAFSSFFFSCVLSSYSIYTLCYIYVSILRYRAFLQSILFIIKM